MAERITGHTELIGLMAYPIRHSSSPAMHNEAFAYLGLDYAYLAFEVDNNTLEDAVKGIRALKLVGSNVSMPNKTVVGQYLDKLSPAAELCGAVNTIVNENGVLTGHITDGIGFMQALKDNDIDVIGKKMTIAGAGGAATAIEIQAALDGVKEISIFNIHDKFWANAEETVRKINEKTDCKATLYDLDDKEKLREEMADSYIFVNGTGVGMKPLEGMSVVPDKSFFRPELIVIDVPYSPLETKMRSMAKEVGCKTMNGLGMMLFQGAAAFKLWTGKDMPIEHMKEVDVFDVSCGLNGSIQYQIDANYLPDGWRSFMAKAVKEKYNKPCITVGNIRDPQVAEDILAGGDADFIGMGRGLIADPEWVNKVEFGNVCDIRKCISCNIGCAGHRIGLNQPIRCTVNPAVNSGEDYMKTKVNKPCNVVVIGGGTAGLEAACTAAEVGCTTFLIEKKAELGGLASVISKIPDKKRLADFPNYMIHRASKLHNLFVFKNTSATVDMVKALNPDIIVNATGSVPTLPPITGLHDLVDKDGTNVATVLKMIERINEYPEDMKGQKIAIIGGGAVGLDVMEFFTERGAEVTMVEMLPMIGNGLDPVTKCDTNAKMAKYGVKQMTNTALQEVKNDRFIVKNPEGEIEEIPFDYGFICLGMRANTPVLSEIDEAFSNTNVEIVNIGDSKRARRIIEGTEEGRNILNVLARHDYL